MDKNKILEDYIGNDMKKIRKICKKIISKTSIPDAYLEEYYDKAVDVLMESMNTYDEARNCKFSTYFYGNLVRRTGTWLRDRMRFKRCNLETDSKGKIKRDENENPIIIPDMSIYMQVDPDEDYTLEESIASFQNVTPNSKQKDLCHECEKEVASIMRLLKGKHSISAMNQNGESFIIVR